MDTKRERVRRRHGDVPHPDRGVGLPGVEGKYGPGRLVGECLSLPRIACLGVPGLAELPARRESEKPSVRVLPCAARVVRGCREVSSQLQIAVAQVPIGTCGRWRLEKGQYQQGDVCRGEDSHGWNSSSASAIDPFNCLLRVGHSPTYSVRGDGLAPRRHRSRRDTVAAAQRPTSSDSRFKAGPRRLLRSTPSTCLAADRPPQPYAGPPRARRYWHTAPGGCAVGHREVFCQRVHQVPAGCLRATSRATRRARSASTTILDQCRTGAARKFATLPTPGRARVSP